MQQVYEISAQILKDYLLMKELISLKASDNRANISGSLLWDWKRHDDTLPISGDLSAPMGGWKVG